MPSLREINTKTESHPRFVGQAGGVCLEQHLNLLEGVVAKCRHEVGPIHDKVDG
jgi:hypothetical protein